ncbi:MAG TPA: Rid family hydrolase [Thermoanaerobaculia bacterium]|nr:Rid family hydrolase [Thermoanaerobaculia bacterium]
MTEKIRIETDGAPPATGTYSQAIRHGNLVFVTGQTGRNPQTSDLEDGLEAQTRRVLANIGAVLSAAGCSPGDILQSTLILADMKDFKQVDSLYIDWLPEDRKVCNPARTVLQAPLPHGALVMLEVIAGHPANGYVRPDLERPFLQPREKIFEYFAFQLGEKDWRGKDVLDFGGNVGALLQDPTATLDEERYWCMEIIKEAVELGRQLYPRAHWVFYDKYNFFFNPHGDPNLKIPDCGGQKFDVIAAYSVFTNNRQADMLDMVPQLVDRLKPGGVLAFTFIDPHHHSYRHWHADGGPDNLRLQLEKSRREGVDVDVEGMLARARGARWCILVNERDLFVETHEIREYAPEEQESYHIYYTAEYMAELFPGAEILPPAANEIHHCCLLRRRAE